MAQRLQPPQRIIRVRRDHTIWQGDCGHLPNLPEWGIAAGIVGYAFLLLTLGALFLPIFNGKDHH
jgi:hypothetical protein